MRFSSLRSSVLLPALIVFTVARAQIRPDLKFDHISLKDGLSNFTVTAIAQDRQGFLWFGTEDGLNKYDGYTFRQFLYTPADTGGLPSPHVTALCVDSAGSLWIGTQNGLVVHEPVPGDFHRVKLPPSGRTGPLSAAILSLYCDMSGVVWIGTQGGALRCDAREESRITDAESFHREEEFGPNPIRCCAEDSAGSFWVGTVGGGLVRHTRSSGTISTYRSATDDPRTLVADDVTSLAVDVQGVLWVGTTSGVCAFDHRTETFRRYPLADDAIADLLVDARGNLWVGTVRVGLRKYDRRSDMFLQFDHEPGNPHSLDKSRIHTLFEDKGGLLWVATYRGGLNRYDPGRDQFINIRPSSVAGMGLSGGPVYAICEDRYGEVWIGTVGGGLNRYNPGNGTFRVYHRLRRSGPRIPRTVGADSLQVQNEAILSLFEDSSGELWIGTADALYHHDRKRDRFDAFPTPSFAGGPRIQTNVKCIGEDAEGRLWIGTHGGGAHRFDRTTGKFQSYRTDPKNPRSLSGMIVWAICRDHTGTMWFGTFGAGLNRYDPVTDDFTRFAGDRSSSAGYGSIYCITEGPDLALWVGSFAGGMHRIEPGGGSVTTYMKNEGLPNNFVKAILFDARGFLWASTDLGLSRFDPRTKSFRNYTQEDGLHDNVFLSGAYHRGKSGRMYFGGENGLTMFFPDSIRENRHIPPVVLTNVQIYDRAYEARGTGWMAEGVTLRYDENFLQFEFAALDFSNPSRQRYAYLMEGFDRSWVSSGNRRFARYTNLPPGRYVFRVKGSNNHGLWNEVGTSLAITITPPFWQRWWVQLLAGALVVIALWFAYRYRVNKLLELERLRVRIASDLHDDIGSSLTRISLQSELIQEGIEPEEMHRSLSGIATMSRELVTTMSDIVWSIDARNDTWGNLLEKMHDSAVGILSPKGVEVTFSHSGLDTKRKIPVDTRENLYLICKEAVNNVAKHSTARNVSIVLRNDHDKFTMVIADDGQGLPAGTPAPGTHAKRSGHGLRNMQMRAERLGGKVERTNDGGLKVVFTGPRA